MRIDSLRLRLLIWLLVPLAAAATVNLWLTAGTVRGTADAVTDRMLLASARAIAEQTTVADGVIDPLIPPVALEMFSTGHGDRVYYHVQDAAGRLLTGYPDLPLPKKRLASFDPLFYAASYRDQPLRLVALAHPVAGAAPKASPELVLVGVTLRGRDAMVRDLLSGAFGQQALLLLLAGAVLLAGLTRALAPLLRLRDAVLAREPNDLEPLAASSVLRELRPLVEALNTYMGRVRAQMAAQRRFVANAAHQIKTPLALLSTQASFAQRTEDPAERAEALAALRRTTRQTARLATQMLTLSRAETGARRPRADPVDLAEAAGFVVVELTDTALARGIDLRLETEGDGALVVSGDGTMLREMIVNLVDNALRYSPPDGLVRVSLAGEAGEVVLRVADSGPGIPMEERARVFERFYRIPGTGPEGSGLGLAIAREVCETAGGTIALADPAEGPGIVVEVRLPGVG